MHKSKVLLFLGLLTLIFVVSCVERFEPKVDGIEEFFIVDGILSNAPGPYTIKLFNALGFDQEDNTPIENANVIIRDDEGMEVVLIEDFPGIYRTTGSGFTGQVGRSYQVDITSNGSHYQSNFQQLKASEPIRKLYSEVEYHYFVDDQAEVPGIQFYIDGPEQIQEDSYFLWLEEATFKYRSELPINYSYSGTVTEFPKPDSLGTCYRTDIVKDIATYSPDQFSGNQIEQIELNFQRADELQLSIRYSLLAKQYSISKEAYEFWSGVESQLSNDSDLFTKQPYQIRGNIFNVDDNNQTVLGFFTVGGVTEERIFVDKPNVPIPTKLPCFLDFMGYAWIFVYGPDDWPIYVTETAEGGRALAGLGCMDCRELGGSIEEPDFWQ